MKQRYLLVIIFFLIARMAFSCSCGPWVADFYNNVSKHSTNGIIKIDSIYDLVDSTGGCSFSQPMAIVTLLKGFNFLDKNDGDTIMLFGQDGINCAVGFGQFTIGDTLIVALDKSASCLIDDMYCIPFASAFACGIHYLRITNGMHEGLSLNEIEEKIRGIMTDITELNIFNQIQIFPNPFTDRIMISSTSTSLLKFELANSMGQVVFNTVCNPENRMIDISHLPRGLYIASIQQSEGIRRRSFKLIKE